VLFVDVGRWEGGDDFLQVLELEGRVAGREVLVGEALDGGGWGGRFLQRELRGLWRGRRYLEGLMVVLVWRLYGSLAEELAGLEKSGNVHVVDVDCELLSLLHSMVFD